MLPYPLTKTQKEGRKALRHRPKGGGRVFKGGKNGVGGLGRGEKTANRGGDRISCRKGEKEGWPLLLEINGPEGVLHFHRPYTGKRTRRSQGKKDGKHSRANSVLI